MRRPMNVGDARLFRKPRYASLVCCVLGSLSLGPEIAAALAAELAQEGAVDVAELGPDDWHALVTWGRMKRFERKRLLQCLPQTSA